MSQHLPASLHLKVITPRKLLVEMNVDEVSLPSLEGYLGILPGHRSLITMLGKGVLSYRMGKKEDQIFVRGGYAEVQPDRVLVFTQTSEDEEKATSAG